ncbi:UDP-D-apiose/UDP-D-xylose synthase [Hordeum vulgare]|nr:UDP-D-apiose/UDP-D-xylose synthase [Hordeum vulgare]
MSSGGRVDLDGGGVVPLTICMIGAGGFIGSHLCEKLTAETPDVVLAVDVYSDKIRHLVDPPPPHLAGRISFHRLNVKNDPRLEGLVKMADLTINLAAICTPADYNTRPLDTIYSNLIDVLPVVKYCSENGKRLIHFSTCEVYGKTIGSFLPKDHPLRKVMNMTSPSPPLLTPSVCTCSRVRKYMEQLAALVSNYPLSDPEDEQLQGMMREIWLKFSVITGSLGAKLGYEGRPTSSEQDIEDM